MSTNSIRHDVLYPYPPERVWATLTDSATLARWLLPNDFEARLGHCFIFTAAPQADWSGIIECEVIELDEPRRLAYTWRGHPSLPATLVTFTLEPRARGTRLRLEHTELVVPATRRAHRPTLYALDWGSPLSRLFHLSVDEAALTAELLAYLTDPVPSSRNARPLVQGLRRFVPDMLAMLDEMILEGVTHQAQVAHLVHVLASDVPRIRLLSADDHLPLLVPGATHDLPVLARLYRLQVDEDTLADEFFSFVVAAQDARAAWAAGHELRAVAPETLSVLDQMVLEGVDLRHDVAAFAHAVVTEISA